MSRRRPGLRRQQGGARRCPRNGSATRSASDISRVYRRIRPRRKLWVGLQPDAFRKMANERIRPPRHSRAAARARCASAPSSSAAARRSSSSR
jgi:hypothetical protein